MLEASLGPSNVCFRAEHPIVHMSVPKIGAHIGTRDGHPRHAGILDPSNDEARNRLLQQRADPLTAAARHRPSMALDAQEFRTARASQSVVEKLNLLGPEFGYLHALDEGSHLLQGCIHVNLL